MPDTVQFSNVISLSNFSDKNYNKVSSKFKAMHTLFYLLYIKEYNILSKYKIGSIVSNYHTVNVDWRFKGSPASGSQRLESPDPEIPSPKFACPTSLGTSVSKSLRCLMLPHRCPLLCLLRRLIFEAYDTKVLYV